MLDQGLLQDNDQEEEDKTRMFLTMISTLLMEKRTMTLLLEMKLWRNCTMVVTGKLTSEDSSTSASGGSEGVLL